MPSGDNKTVTSNAPPAYAGPGLKQLAGDTMDLYKSGKGYDQFAGSSVTPFSQQTQAGLNQLTANNTGPDQLYNATNDGLLGMLGNGGLNAGQQDALGKINDLYGQTDQNFNSALDFQSGQTMDAVNRQFNGLGGYGGSDNFQTAAREVGNQRNVAASNNFNAMQAQKAGLANSLFSGNQQGQQNIQSAAGLLPGMQSAKDYGANQLLTAGAVNDAQQQALLNDQISKFDKDQSLGRQKISDATGLLSGVVGNYNTQTTNAPKQSTLQSLLGGGLGLLGLFG